MKRAITMLCLLGAFAAVMFGQTAPPEDVVATVNGTNITIEDMTAGAQGDNDMIRHSIRKRANGNSGRRQQIHGDPEWMLEQAINQTLIMEEAEKAKMGEDPDVLAATESFKRAMMVEMYYSKVLAEQVKPSEEEILKEYEQTGRFNVEQHALVVRQWAQSEEEANSRIEEMKATDLNDPNIGLDMMFFPEYRGDDESHQGGNRGSNADRSDGKRGDERNSKMEMYDQVKAASPGDIVGPINMGGSFEIILVAKQVPAGKRPFEEVKDEIESYMIEERLNDLRNSQQEELRKNATITVYYENLNKAFEGK